VKQSEVITLIKEAHESITRFKREYSPNVHEIQNHINQKLMSKIKIEELKPVDVGRKVLYQPRLTSNPEDKIEEGVIKHWNDTFVFVDYGDGRGIATPPYLLEFL
jgi:hypothetical protein